MRVNATAPPRWGAQRSRCLVLIRVRKPPALLRSLAWLNRALMLWLLVAPAVVFAAGGKPATKLVNVADTRGMSGGISKLIADTYNDNLVLFGLLVVVVMAGMGAVLGFTFDKLFGLLGINLGKLDHHE
jgi:hypothetical protein